VNSKSPALLPGFFVSRLSQYPSLRALPRSNPESRKKELDCFVATAPRNDEGNQYR
jgi:hypothetical protein